MEIAIAIGIAAVAVYIIYKNIKKSSKGHCSGCSKKCPSRK